MTIIHLDDERKRRNLPVTVRPNGIPQSRGHIVLSSAERNTLMAVFRRFYGEVNQLTGYMSKLGIVSTVGQKLRADAHAIRADIVAVAVRDDASKP
jgi:hypothetical protein